jgi:hypothetical protein
MELYERSFDLRVQADYGRKSKNVELNKERVGANLIGRDII